MINQNDQFHLMFPAFFSLIFQHFFICCQIRSYPAFIGIELTFDRLVSFLCCAMFRCSLSPSIFEKFGKERIYPKGFLFLHSFHLNIAILRSVAECFFLILVEFGKRDETVSRDIVDDG